MTHSFPTRPSSDPKVRKAGGGALRKCAASFVSPRGICAVGVTIRGTDDMTMMLEKDAREDLLERGYSRRTIGRISALMAAGAAAGNLLIDRKSTRLNSSH